MTNNYTMRKKIIAGNWKMYKTIQEADQTITSLSDKINGTEINNAIYIAAPFPFLDRLIQKFGNNSIHFGAQNINENQEGAFTGETSGKMLQSIGCKFVLIGHSERREIYKESNEVINLKIKAALLNQLQPVFCCGERLEERNNGSFFATIKSQLEESLFTLTEAEINQLVIAYEPVWAIGTGLTASPEQAQEMHHFIREELRKKFGELTSENCIILYGGSVKPNNAATLFSQPDIDGGLVGGASLNADDFFQIITAV